MKGGETMKVIAVIEDGKLLHKKVSDEEYARIQKSRDPTGMEWFYRKCKLP